MTATLSTSITNIIIAQQAAMITAIAAAAITFGPLSVLPERHRRGEVFSIKLGDAG